jgi:hypothetical protein
MITAILGCMRSRSPKSFLLTDKDDELMYPHCIDGERAGPLEDSGGIWGYKSMLDILKDPNNENYAEIRERVGDFDPEYVNIEEINASLVKMFKPTPQKAPGHNSAIPIQNR